MAMLDPETFWPDRAGDPATVKRGQVTVTIRGQRRRVVAYQARLTGGPAIVAIGLVIAKARARRRLGFLTYWLDRKAEIAGFHPGEGGGKAVAFGPALSGWRRDAA